MDISDMLSTGSTSRHRSPFNRRQWVTLVVIVTVCAGYLGWRGGQVEHAESASGARLCDVLSDHERSVLLGRPADDLTEGRGTSSSPAGCHWKGDEPDDLVELVASSPQAFRSVIKTAADTARSIAGSGAPPVARLDALSRSPVRSCDLYADYARVLGQDVSAGPLVVSSTLPESYGGGEGIVTATCRDDEVISLTVVADDLDTGSDAQQRVSAMLMLIQQRLG